MVVFHRPEEAVPFYRQAADKFVQIGDAAGEGRTRNNLGDSLRRLRRFDEARQEIRRAIECNAPFGHAAQPWTTWAVLAAIETDAGDLAYRRGGGENHFADGRLALAVTRSLLAGDAAEPAALLDRLAADPDAAWLLPFVRALQAVVAGSRDRTLAEAPELDHTMAAEILLLIETLERGSGTGLPSGAS